MYGSTFQFAFTACLTLPGGGGNITCCGYGYVPPIWVGIWVQNSLNKGPFSADFPLNLGGFSRNWKRIVKNG